MGAAGSSPSASEPWVHGGVRQRPEAVAEANAERVTVAGGELALAQQDFLVRRDSLFERELVADPRIAARCVQRQRLEQADVGAAVQRQACEVEVGEVLREGGAGADLAPRLPQPQ